MNENNDAKEFLDFRVVENRPSEQEWIGISEEEVTLSSFIDKKEENKLFKLIKILNEEQIEYSTYFEEKIIGVKSYKYDSILTLYIRKDDFNKVLQLMEYKYGLIKSFGENEFVVPDELKEIEEEEVFDTDGQPLIKSEIGRKIIETIIVILCLIFGVLLIYGIIKNN